MRKITGADLRAMRRFAGMTTVEMAAAAGVKTRKTYENWERDISFPNVNQYFQMVSACGLDPETLIHLINAKQQQQRYLSV